MWLTGLSSQAHGRKLGKELRKIQKDREKKTKSKSLAGDKSKQNVLTSRGKSEWHSGEGRKYHSSPGHVSHLRFPTSILCTSTTWIQPLSFFRCRRCVDPPLSLVIPQNCLEPIFTVHFVGTKCLVCLLEIYVRSIGFLNVKRVTSKQLIIQDYLGYPLIHSIINAHTDTHHRNVHSTNGKHALAACLRYRNGPDDMGL